MRIGDSLVRPDAIQASFGVLAQLPLLEKVGAGRTAGMVTGQNGGMTSKSVPKNVPMIGTSFSSIKQRRGFAPIH